VASPRPINGLLLAWTSEWSSFPELADRIGAAARSHPFAVAALHDYSLAYRQNLNSHPDGITAVALLKLLDHLRNATGIEAPTPDGADLFDLIPAVRLAARADLERAPASSEHAAGAHATLGELYLVSGDQASPSDRDATIFHYSQAAAFEPVRQALMDRLRLFSGLGFRSALVSEVTRMLQGQPPHSAP
jgi:hypothetical protein